MGPLIEPHQLLVTISWIRVREPTFGFEKKLFWTGDFPWRFDFFTFSFDVRLKLMALAPTSYEHLNIYNEAKSGIQRYPVISNMSSKIIPV